MFASTRTASASQPEPARGKLSSCSLSAHRRYEADRAACGCGPLAPELRRRAGLQGRLPCWATYPLSRYEPSGERDRRPSSGSARRTATGDCFRRWPVARRASASATRRSWATALAPGLLLAHRDHQHRRALKPGQGGPRPLVAAELAEVERPEDVRGHPVGRPAQIVVAAIVTA